MKLLIDNKELTDSFSELIESYNQFYCCVAWAGNPHGFYAAKQLKKYSSKIKKAVVGLHFYQTHPNFIKTFMDNDCFRFYLKSDGVFHDKIYLFSNSPKDWCAIIGSSNFTNGGFVSNSECNVLISEKDDEEGTIYKGLVDRINKIWQNSNHFSDKMLNEYEEDYNRQQGKRESLSKIIKPRKHDFNSSPLSIMTWDEYCALLRKSERLKDCLEVLSDIQSLFKKHIHLCDIEEINRLEIAGFVAASNEYAHFGTTKRNHLFGQMVKSNDPSLSKALDNIPFKGDVSFDNYQKFIQFFSNRWKDPMATATRLLAMKRPDLFLCVNGKNKERLAKYLNIPKSRLILENYWDEVIEPIHESIWFKTNNPDIDKNFWPYRIALLDVLIYEP